MEQLEQIPLSIAELGRQTDLSFRQLKDLIEDGLLPAPSFISGLRVTYTANQLPELKAKLKEAQETKEEPQVRLQMQHLPILTLAELARGADVNPAWLRGKKLKTSLLIFIQIV